jgi:hypothetical protein
MMIPSRRKLGAAALIIAGIGAFLVPFLLHSPSTQGTSSNNGGTNPNNGTHTTTPTPTTPTTPTNPGTNDNGKDKGGSGDTTDTPGTCADKNSSQSDVSDQANDASDLNTSHAAKDSADNSKTNHGHAYGLLKNQLDTTVAMIKSMGTQNAAFHSHHDTKTDNHTVHTEQASSDSSNDHDSSCAEKAETNDN